MALLEFNNADAEQMKKVQAIVTSALMPFRHQVEAALVIFALVRCARILLNLYPEHVQRQLLGVLCDFLENRETPPGEAAQSPLWLPEPSSGFKVN